MLQNGVDNPQTKQEHFIKTKRSPSEEDYDDDKEEDIFQKIIGM